MLRDSSSSHKCFPSLGKLPHVCGGYAAVIGQSTGRAVIECYRYQPTDDTWAKSGTMAYSHDKSGFTYHEQLGLIISGAKDGNGTTKVEHTLDGQIIQVPVCKIK